MADPDKGYYDYESEQSNDKNYGLYLLIALIVPPLLMITLFILAYFGVVHFSPGSVDRSLQQSENVLEP